MRDNAPLDVDLSDIDFDDDEEDGVPIDITVVPGSPRKLDPREIDSKLNALHKNAPKDAAARVISDNIEQALLAVMEPSHVDRLSELEIAALTARQYLADALSEKSPNPAVVEAAKSLYMKRLVEQRNYAAWVRARYANYLPPASASLQKVGSDPLLTKSEIISVNNSPVELTDPRGVATRFVSKKDFDGAGDLTDAGLDAKFYGVAQLEERSRRLNSLADGLSLPDGWKAEKADETELERIKNLPSRSDRAYAYKAFALKSKPRYVVIRPTAPGLDRHRISLEANPEATALIPSQKEVNAVISGFEQISTKLDITKLEKANPDSELNFFASMRDRVPGINAAGDIEIRVGTHLAERNSNAREVKSKGTNGIWSPSGQVYLNLANIRQFDNPGYVPRSGYYAVDPDGALDKLTGTTIHELGHAIQSSILSYADMRPQMRQSTVRQGPDEVLTRYAATKGCEQFAESMLLFVLRGKMSPRLRQQLIQQGILLN